MLEFSFSNIYKRKYNATDLSNIIQKTKFEFFFPREVQKMQSSRNSIGLHGKGET